MCGIAGIINNSKKYVTTNELKSMTDCMIHRGPDDEGFFVDGQVGLGMRRLSIIDVSGGHQPITNENETIWVVMNGEIYNYLELRDGLKQRGHMFRTESDTEVLVHGYEEKGFDFVHDLNGMFSFALYDKKRSGVWVVRDRLGIKPLYYAQKNGRILFSSDINTFPKDLKKDIDMEALLHYFGLGYIPNSMTLYSHIKKLPPGHWLWMKDGNISKQSYWKISQFQTSSLSQSEAEEKLRELLHDAIKIQLRADVPIGIMLSGGVDSSAIAAIAAKNLDHPIHTFTINFTKKNGSDSIYARQIAKQYQSEHEEMVLHPENLLDALEDVIKIMDEPLADSAIIPTYLISQFARTKGIKVMLSGAGGDEIFGGYLRHYKPKIGSPSFFAESLSQPLREGLGKIWGIFQPHRGHRVWDEGVAYLSGVFGTDLGFYKKVFQSDKYFAHLIDILTVYGKPIRISNHEMGYHYSRMHFDLTHYLVDNILALNDKGTMGASVEGRVPLLDHRIVEFAFSLPERINILGKKPKGLFCQVLQSYLPQEILDRNKEGFNAPVNTWMGNQFFDRIRDELSSFLVPPLTHLLQPQQLKTFFAYQPKQSFLSYTLFSLYVFNRWYRTHYL